MAWASETSYQVRYPRRHMMCFSVVRSLAADDLCIGALAGYLKSSALLLGPQTRTGHFFSDASAKAANYAQGGRPFAREGEDVALWAPGHLDTPVGLLVWPGGWHAVHVLATLNVCNLGQGTNTAVIRAGNKIGAIKAEAHAPDGTSRGSKGPYAEQVLQAPERRQSIGAANSEIAAAWRDCQGCAGGSVGIEGVEQVKGRIVEDSDLAVDGGSEELAAAP